MTTASASAEPGVDPLMLTVLATRPMLVPGVVAAITGASEAGHGSGAGPREPGPAPPGRGYRWAWLTAGELAGGAWLA